MEYTFNNIFLLLPHQGRLEEVMLGFALLMARLVTISNLVPFLGGKNAPAQVKLGIAATIAIVLWPALDMTALAPITRQPFLYIALFLKEIFVGLVIGLVTSKIFYVAEMAGQIVDVARGANQIQLMVPELQERSSPFGNINFQLLLVLFLALNLHQFFFDALAQSFVIIPIHSWPTFHNNMAAFFDAQIVLFSQIFAIAVTLALPVIIIGLVVDIGFGLMNKIAPQINAYFMSLPAKALSGIVIFLAAFSIMVERLLQQSYLSLKQLYSFIEMMR